MMPGQLGPSRRVPGTPDQAVVGQGLVLGRDALGDAHHEGHAGGGRLHDGVGGELRRHRDERGVGPGGLDGLGHRGEDRDALDVLTAPLGLVPPTTLVP
jgi:hypothetical protein